jgi:hypothetical protein
VEAQSDGVGGTHRDALITKCGNAPPTIDGRNKKSDSESSNFLCNFCSSFGGRRDSFIHAVHSCERARCVDFIFFFFKEID